jgi:hypothetical protein
MPKYDGSQAQNRTLTGVDVLAVHVVYDNPPRVTIDVRLRYSAGPPSPDSFDLRPADPVNNLKPRNFIRTQVSAVRLSQCLDKAIQQAIDAKYGLTSTPSSGGDSETEIP